MDQQMGPQDVEDVDGQQMDYPPLIEMEMANLGQHTMPETHETGYTGSQPPIIGIPPLRPLKTMDVLTMVAQISI